MSSAKERSRLPRKAPVSKSSGDLLAVFGKMGLAMKRWTRSNLPDSGGMTVPRASILLSLADKDEGVGMSELGEYLGMSPRSMTVLVDGLEREGLVRRVPHQRDRRVTLVEITETGKRLATKELDASRLATASLFEDLTSEERSELKRLVTKLLESLHARGIEVPTHDQN